MERRLNGNRLKEARLFRGKTVVELTELAGCTRQTIGQYESGIYKGSPDVKIIKSIAEQLNFPYEFFYENDQRASTGPTYFRSLLTTSSKYQNEQKTRAKFIEKTFSFLEEHISFPPLNLPNQIYDTPKEAAKALREQWSLEDKPIKNLVYETEKRGIIVNRFPTEDKYIDAFSQLLKTDNTYTFLIAYSRNKNSASRIHFDIAHELGHILLHDWNENELSWDKEEFKMRENEANEFASEFLLPEGKFKQMVSLDPLNLRHYQNLKEIWRVSMSAMIRRSKTLGVISFDEYQMLIKTMQKRGIMKKEPLDDILVTSPPSLLYGAVELLLSDQGGYTGVEILEALSEEQNFSITPEIFEDLLNLPSGTLRTKYSGLRLVKYH